MSLKIEKRIPTTSERAHRRLIPTNSNDDLIVMTVHGIEQHQRDDQRQWAIRDDRSDWTRNRLNPSHK